MELFVCFVALRSKSTAMVMEGRSVHLTTFFLGKLEQAINQYFMHILSLVTDNDPSWMIQRKGGKDGTTSHCNLMFTLILLISFVLKMLPAFYFCCIYIQMHFRNVSTWNQTIWTPIRLLQWSGSILIEITLTDERADNIWAGTWYYQQLGLARLIEISVNRSIYKRKIIINMKIWKSLTFNGCSVYLFN